jgi:hypothetical protein
MCYKENEKQIKNETIREELEVHRKFTEAEGSFCMLKEWI